jgi:hypothetical protein
MKTKVRLAQDLKEHGAPDWMIRKAIDGYYDDYESPIATPCIQLVIDLNLAGLLDMANEAKNGKYDGTKEEADAWLAKEGQDLLDTKTFQALFGGEK